MISIERDGFGRDPLGYSARGVFQWKQIESTVTGSTFDPFALPTQDDLKNPILWLAQAEAISQAARAIIKTEPAFENMPLLTRPICDSQFCATGLMLVGYSLEVALKAMMIIEKGIEGYMEIEKKQRHHRLQDLAHFVPDLTKKDNAILRGLTHFVYWAGRYPDPGTGKEKDTLNIFDLSEKYRISAHDLFATSSKVMKYAHVLVESKS